MKKYDYDILIEAEGHNSMGCILRSIPIGSTVLEVGCSYGYMTKFMKERLNCVVSVVEIDPEAFKEARQYAADGLCCDVDTLEWVNHFKTDIFDVIVFADVFEHLRSPVQVLQSTKKLLKEDGMLLFSVPNLAHNDVLSNLFNNRFQYTPLGLLDNTHIHFFTYHSLEPFANSGGYSIIEEECTYKAPFSTEQAEFIPDGQKTFFETLFVGHTCGDIYQFVCKLQKKEYAAKHQIGKTSFIEKLLGDGFESTVFFDYGEGFHPQDFQVISQSHQENRVYNYYVTIPAGVRAIRLDPIEGEKCVVREIRLNTDDSDRNPDIVGSNGVYCCGEFMFDSIDPQIYIDFKGEQLLHLDVTLSLTRLKEHQWHEFTALFECCEDAYRNALDFKNGQIVAMESERKKLVECLSVSENALNEVGLKLSNRQAECEALREEHRKILNSKSWRYTEIFRKLINRINQGKAEE